MIVSFCGHSRGVGDDVTNWLYEIIEEVIIEGANTFYLGGYGAFDGTCAKICTELKKKYPHIQRILVIPYLDRDFNKDLYDGSYYPELETVPKKFAISKRNEKMVEESDIVISYVWHDIGSGAYKTLQYAKRKKKKIYNYLNKDI